ncbi:MAG: hypothetical protein HFG41_09040 [Coprococcus sp.]|nr:hypothetical protein [Coprococcus sp.]
MYDLSKPQQSVYDMEKYAGGAISVICGSVIYRGARTQNELEHAVNYLYQINDALRMHIICTEEGMKQTVEKFISGSIEMLNFATKGELDVYACRYAREPIDIEGKICEIKIIFFNDGYGLLIKMHHLIGDAWTMSLVCSQFNSILKGEEPIAYSSIESILGVGRVGILDNFFDLGGDSLKAVELIARIEENGYYTDTRTIFSCDTVKELAEALMELLSSGLQILCHFQ